MIPIIPSLEIKGGGGNKDFWDYIPGGTFLADTVDNFINNTDARRDLDEAAEKQQEAIKYGIDIQNKQFQQNREDMMPWLESGRSGLGRLNELMGQGYFDMPDENLEGPSFSFNYEQDPGYKFRVGQATDAIKKAAAARGNRYTPGMFAELSDRIGGMAYDDYDRSFARQYGQYQDQYGRRQNAFQRRAGNLQDRYNRLSSMAGMGQQQASALANLGSNYAGNIANAYGQLGQSQAGSIIGKANLRMNSPLNQIFTQGMQMAPYLLL